MSKITFLLAVLAMVFHATSWAERSLESGGGRGGDSSTTTTSRGTNRRPGGDGSSSESSITNLEKEEEEIDKQIMKEIMRRENETTSMASKETAKVTVDLNGEQCDAALKVDLDIPGSLALCACGKDEILVNGSCIYYSKGTKIDMEKFIFYMEEVPVTDLRVRLHEVECLNQSTHQNFTFEKGMFYLRNRGDVVLTDKAGALAGLRISDYCVDHSLDKQGNLTWKLKACVPHPSVPRCCPPNQTLRNGTCQMGPSPNYLVPPIQVDPRGSSGVNWPYIKNHVNNFSCDVDEMRTEALDMNGSFLLALPSGLAYRWHPYDRRSQFMFCPDFCVDGRQSIDGTIEYLANFCYNDPTKRRKQACKTKSCIQKCCDKGEVMSLDHYRCIKVDEASFDPPVSGNLSDYEVITGRPECSIHLSAMEQIYIDSEGNMQHDDYTLPTKDYCVDTFARQGKKATEALICPSASSIRTWWIVRPIIFPVCQVISLFFLGITVGFYLLAPVLLKQGGWHQLSYVMSLMLAYASTFSVNVYQPIHGPCIAVALLMQLGFLSTFFWLCIMCFDIEGKIRSLRHFRAYVPLHPMAYVAFGFGGPIFIGLVTLILQVAVPYGVPGIIKPSLGISRCWFHGDTELLLYFYGPIAILFLCNITLIASTAWNYNKIEKGALGIMMKSSSENGRSGSSSLEFDRQKQTKKNFAEFKHTFLLLSLMCFCWITEVLSWKIPPLELWALTDILNSLQGLFIFVIFLCNRRNRKTLKKRHPWLYLFVQPVKDVIQKLRGLFSSKNRNFGNSSSSEEAKRNSREPSISSEFSELSENGKPQEPTAS